ncbi:MAG: hypothetical protein NW226_06675 [Microscillaceae bacterium]|nr:hypothetical protein [Microscillaceae bacterium]
MKIVSVFVSTKDQHTVRQYIATEDRLEELLDIQAGDKPENMIFSDNKPAILVRNAQIEILPDWYNHLVPYIFPPHITLQENTFLGTIFGLLDNFEKTWDYLQEYPLLQEWDNYVRIKNGYPIDVQDFERAIKHQDNFEKYRASHNLALVQYYIYPHEPYSIPKTHDCFKIAIEYAPDDVFRAFSIKHYANFLLDYAEAKAAAALIEYALKPTQNPVIKASLKFVLVQAMVKMLSVPYDPELLKALKENLWETLQFYESKQCLSEAGMLLMDAAFIAQIDHSFSEALSYLNKAIQYLESEELDEMLGTAWFRKGILLYTWSKSGSPQFYKSAIESFQQALKIFDKETTPEIFADIHHHLGIIYSEMPDENKKRGVWAALSASSFKEALAYFTKADFPYEYASVSNNYANAMTLYPPMKKADNYAKALELYEEALSVRDAQTYPYERALTLINFLEASWYVSNEEDSFNEIRYRDMVAKALEIKNLVDDPQLHEEAQKHLEELEKLGKI